MEKLISLLSLALCCFAASAQPTSFGGVTPGKTTREELKSLVIVKETSSDYFKLGDKDAGPVLLKQFEHKYANVLLRNDVVYEVSVSVDTPELEQALNKKYGQPKIKIGGLRTVNCQNKFGASFNRIAGNLRLLWPVKDGVQGEFESDAKGSCPDTVFHRYVLRHVATVKAVEEESKEKERKEVEKQRNKLDGAL